MHPFQWREMWVILPQSKQKPQNPLLVHYVEELTRPVNTTLVALRLRLFKESLVICQNPFQQLEHHPTNFFWAPSEGNVFKYPAYLPTWWNTLKCGCSQKGKDIDPYTAIPSSTNSFKHDYAEMVHDSSSSYQHPTRFHPVLSDDSPQSRRP